MMKSADSEDRESWQNTGFFTLSEKSIDNAHEKSIEGQKREKKRVMMKSVESQEI